MARSRKITPERKALITELLESYKLEDVTFILKGGFLIAATVGLDARATMDMNATIKELAISK